MVIAKGTSDNVSEACGRIIPSLLWDGQGAGTRAKSFYPAAFALYELCEPWSTALYLLLYSSRQAPTMRGSKDWGNWPTGPQCHHAWGEALPDSQGQPNGPNQRCQNVVFCHDL